MWGLSIKKSTGQTTGAPSSNYKHRRASTLLHNIRNIRICMEKKNTYRFRNLRKSKDFNKKQLTSHKMCVTSLPCGLWADLWPFYWLYCKRFSLYIKVYTSEAIDRTLVWTPCYRWKIAKWPETQITHTQGGRQSLAPVDINTQERKLYV